MKKVRFAIVGCGAISKKHIESIRRIDRAELACVCDTDMNAAKNTGDANSVKYYNDPKRMAKEEDFDVFSILTPSGTHTRMIKELAVRNKDFVVEKPLGLDLGEIDDVINICDKRGLKLFVVHQNRFNKPIQALRKAVAEGRFGKMVLGTVRIRWTRTQEYYDSHPWRGAISQGGGVLINQASHHLDMLTWLMGDVKSVVAKTTTRLVKIEAEDTCAAILKFKSGALGMVEATTAVRPKDLEGSISILGENGSVEIGGFFMNELKTWNFSKKESADDRVFKEFDRNPGIFAWNHTEYLKDAVDSILKGKNGLVDGREGRRAVELINVIYESAVSGKEVFLKKERT